MVPPRTDTCTTPRMARGWTPTNPSRNRQKLLDLKIIDTEKCKPLDLARASVPVPDCKPCSPLSRTTRRPRRAAGGVPRVLLHRPRPEHKVRPLRAAGGSVCAYVRAARGRARVHRGPRQAGLADGRLEIKFVNGQRTEQPEMRFYDGDVEDPQSGSCCGRPSRPGGMGEHTKVRRGKDRPGPEATRFEPITRRG